MVVCVYVCVWERLRDRERESALMVHYTINVFHGWFILAFPREWIGISLRQVLLLVGQVHPRFPPTPLPHDSLLTLQRISQPGKDLQFKWLFNCNGKLMLLHIRIFILCIKPFKHHLSGSAKFLENSLKYFSYTWTQCPVKITNNKEKLFFVAKFHELPFIPSVDFILLNVSWFPTGLFCHVSAKNLPESLVAFFQVCFYCLLSLQNVS